MEMISGAIGSRGFPALSLDRNDVFSHPNLIYRRYFGVLVAVVLRGDS